MNNEDWKLQPAFLSEYQLKDPIQLLRGYGAAAESLFNDRQLLFDIFYAALGSKIFKDHTPSQIREYVYLFDRLVNILEASHVVGQLVGKGRLIYSYKDEGTAKQG